MRAAVGTRRHRGPTPTVARVAEGLGVAWNTANDAVLAKGKWVLIDDDHRLDGVAVVGVPKTLVEITKLGRTLMKRAEDLLAYFDCPGTSNGPTDAIDGRPEHLRGSALGFRNLTNYIARSLLEPGGFRPQLRPRLA